MGSKPILFPLFLGLLFIGCGHPLQNNANSVAREIGIPKLRADLKVAVEAAAEQHSISSTAWPESIRRFNPIGLEHHMNGIVIVLKRSGKEQEGLLVLFDPKGAPGAGGSGASYEALGEGLFWCFEKFRTPFIRSNLGTNG